MNRDTRLVRNLQWCLTAMLMLSLASRSAGAEAKYIEFSTADGITIAATVAVPGTGQDKAAAVIFIHQGGSSKSEWSSTSIFKMLAEQGILALAYDIRGHGQSAGKADYSTLFDDPLQAPKDLDAAIEWLRKSGRVDMSRIAVVGASIGANLALVAVGTEHFSVKTAVAISGKVSAAYNLAGGAENLNDLHAVFLIAAELEQGGKRAAWASELYEMAAPPRQLEVVAGSSSHGVSVFDDDPMLQQRILDWLLRTL